jgi:hypothetical protein
MQRRSECGRQFEYRKRDDVYHQSGPAAVTVGDHAENKCAHGPHRKREENSFEDGGNLRVEFGGDGADAKSEDEKIEGVERPA